MKHLFTTIAAALLSVCLSAQSYKRSVDEEILNRMVLQAQEDIKARFFSTLVQKNIRTTNYTTYNTLYDCVDILTTEKNSTVMTQQLVKRMAEYGIAYGLARKLSKERWVDVIKAAEDDTLSARAMRHPQKLKAESTPALLDSIFDRLMYQAYHSGPDPKKGDGNEKGEEKAVASVAKIDTGTSSGKNAVHFDELVIGAHSNARATIDNYTIDQVYQLLWHDTLMVRLGLFDRRADDREWQLENLIGVNYDAFWASQADKTIKVAVDNSIQNLGAVLISADAIYTELETILGVSGLQGLDLATFTSDDEMAVKALVKIFAKAAQYYSGRSGQNNKVAIIANTICDYVVFDPAHGEGSNYGFEIDVEAVILRLEERFLGWNESPMKNSFANFRPFFTIGLNYGYFGGPDAAFTEGSSLGQRQVAWAGEKIGIKWRLRDWGYFKTREYNESFRYGGKQYRRLVRPKVPTISNLYWFGYASGVLYSIADLRSDSEFNGVIAGSGFGIQFFNKMELNASYALPVDATYFKDGFINIGFDIPIFDYIRAVKTNGN